MALYAVKYTRTQVTQMLIEADSEAEAISIDSPMERRTRYFQIDAR